MSSAIYSVVIVNKFGSLMFQQDFVRNGKVSSNDYLRLASTFHGLHAISSSLSPVSNSSGIQEIETDSFRLRCLQTPTGLKFYVVAHPSHPDSRQLEALLSEIYALFCDYVLKNAFTEMDQPVRASKFEVNLDKLIRSKYSGTV